MRDSRNKQADSEETVDEGSFKNAMYASILFVGGGIAFFWLILFIIFSVRV